MNHVNEDEVKQSHVTAEQEHCNDHHQGGIEQFLVAAKPFFLRVPWPRAFLQLGIDLGEEVSGSRNHCFIKSNAEHRTSNAEVQLSVAKIRRSAFDVGRSVFAAFITR